MSIQGTENILLELDEEIVEIVSDRIPGKWKKVAYLSSSNLTPFIQNFAERFHFLRVSFAIKFQLNQFVFDPFQSLLMDGKREIWISGLYRIPTYLVGLLIEHAKETKLSPETLNIQLSFSGELNHRGLCADLWNIETRKLKDECDTHTVTGRDLGYFRFLISEGDDSPIDKKRVSCPLYATSERIGDLCRTGRNSNLIGIFQLEFDKTFDLAHWIKRGVAIWCQKI